jgi:hypothetical protein
VVVLRQRDEFLLAGALAWKQRESTTSVLAFFAPAAYKQVLNFLDVPIAACCHTAASGGCAEATRRISCFGALAWKRWESTTSILAFFATAAYKQVLNFLDVAIAAFCHTVVSGGCTQATRRVSVCWCTGLEAVEQVNNKQRFSTTWFKHELGKKFFTRRVRMAVQHEANQQGAKERGR